METTTSSSSSANVVEGDGSNPVRAGAGEDGGRRMKMRVMVAIDESEGSFYALKWAIDNLFDAVLASPVTVGGGAPEERNEGMVFLVHVQPRFVEYGYPIVGPSRTAIFASSAAEEYVRKAQEEKSAAIISRALQICKDKQVKAETIILNGDPREMICEAAEQVHVDLLVLGSRGLGTISRLFIGSVSDYCAHNAKTPILIVKPPMKKDSKEH